MRAALIYEVSILRPCPFNKTTVTGGAESAIPFLQEKKCKVLHFTRGLWFLSFLGDFSYKGLSQLLQHRNGKDTPLISNLSQC